MVKIGVIGAGYWGPNLVRNFSKIKNCQVVGVADLDSLRRRDVTKQFPNVKVLEDYGDLLPLVDGVVVATPLTSHFTLASEALDMGKHVLVEKPFVSKVTEAQELIKKAKTKKLVLMVDHTFEYSQSVRKIKELLDKKTLGKIFNIDMVRVNLGLFQQNYNVLWDLSPHDLSILLFLLGAKPLSVICLGSAHVNLKVEDVAHLYLKFQDGVTATIYLSWLSPIKVRKVTIVGSKKMLEYDDTKTEKLQLYNKGVSLEEEKSPKMPYYKTFQEFRYVYRLGEQKTVAVTEKEPLEVMAGEFIEAIVKKKEPLTSGQKSLGIVEIIEAAQKSLKLGGKEVYLND